MYNISYKSVFVFFIKLLIVGGAFYFITSKIVKDPIFTNSSFFLSVKTAFLKNPLPLFIILLFSALNWFLEVVKWKVLVSSIQKISFVESLKQSLSALTTALFTPNKIGEYGAKAMYYDKKERKKVLLLTFLGNFSQLFVTIIFGILGFLFFSNELPFNTNYFSFPIIISFFFLIGIFLVVRNNTKNTYLKQFFTSLKSISSTIHLKNLLYSVLKYLVFSHQFYFIMVFLEINLGYLTTMPILFSMYFIASIIPSFVIFDWLIKGSVAVALFSVFEVNEITIVFVTSSMWLLNFALPAIIGSYFVLTFDSKKILLKEKSIAL